MINLDKEMLEINEEEYEKIEGGFSAAESQGLTGAIVGDVNILTMCMFMKGMFSGNHGTPGEASQGQQVQGQPQLQQTTHSGTIASSIHTTHADMPF